MVPVVEYADSTSYTIHNHNTVKSNLFEEVFLLKFLSSLHTHLYYIQ